MQLRQTNDAVSTALRIRGPLALEQDGVGIVASGRSPSQGTIRESAMSMPLNPSRALDSTTSGSSSLSGVAFYSTHFHAPAHERRLKFGLAKYKYHSSKGHGHDKPALDLYISVRFYDW